MQTHRLIGIWILIALSMGVEGRMSAQESEIVAPKPPEVGLKDAPASAPGTPGQPLISQRPVVIPREVAPSTPGVPERPPRPEGGNVVVPSNGLRALIKDFQAARENYMAQQRDLLNQIKEASAEEREAIRQQLKEKLDLWLQEQKDHIQTIRDQAKEMKNNLPALKDVIGAAEEEGGRPR